MFGTEETGDPFRRKGNYGCAFYRNQKIHSESKERKARSFSVSVSHVLSPSGSAFSLPHEALIPNHGSTELAHLPQDWTSR